MYFVVLCNNLLLLKSLMNLFVLNVDKKLT